MSILWHGTFGYINNRKISESANTTQSSSSSSSPSSAEGVELNRPVRYLDHAKQSYGGHYNDDLVEEVRSVLKTVPIFLTLIMFQAFLAQVQIS